MKLGQLVNKTGFVQTGVVGTVAIFTICHWRGTHGKQCFIMGDSVKAYLHNQKWVKSLVQAGLVSKSDSVVKNIDLMKKGCNGRLFYT